MRFSAIHKTSTYLMALAAWGSVTLGAEPDPLLLLAIPLLLASWWLEPPRVRPETMARWTVVWNIATVALFVLTVMSILSGEPAVPAGIRFLGFLLVNKLCNRRASKDYQQIYVITFLLLVAATTVNTELTYAVCFTAYVVFATWALILFHLRREMEDNYLLKHSDDASSEKVEVTRILNSRRIVGGAFLAGTSLVSLGIFLGSALLFVFFPRVGFGMFFNQGRRGLSLAGFSDGVRLGGHGLIKDNPAVVMRVEVPPGPLRGKHAPAQHWRGVAFDRYADGRWSRSGEAWPTHLVLRDDRGYLFLRDQRWPVSLPELRARSEAATRLRIYLEPLESSALFAPGRPVAFQAQKPYTLRGMPVLRSGLNDEVQIPHSAGLIYTAFSELEPLRDTELSSAPDVAANDPRYAPYLQLPPELPARVKELGRQLTAGLSGPLAKARAVESYLARFPYTRNMDTDERDEPLDHFLFVRKKGHCEYFASAMAILLRAAGVPTRSVNGFYGGEWNEYGNYIAVRSGDAHSWVEVYIDGHGWVPFDPTPADGRDEMGSGSGGWRAKLRRWFDTLRLKWFKWVIEYDLSRQLSVFRGLREWLSLKALRATLAQLWRTPRQWLAAHKWDLAIFVGVVGGVVALIIWRRRRRKRPTGGPAPRRRQSTVGAAAIALYTRTLDRLARRGHVKAPQATPREFARALRNLGVPGALAFGELTEVYLGARFGEIDTGGPELSRLADAVRDVGVPRPPAAGTGAAAGAS